MLAKTLPWPWVLAVLAAGAAWTSGICRDHAASAQTSEQDNRSLTIRNWTEATVVMTSEVWDKLPRTSVKVPTQEGETTYEGVLMAELLKLVKAPLGKELRGKMLARYVLVKAADDYRVVFALPEVDPESTTQVVLVADRRDGKPLDAKEGPYRLVVPAEKKHARWVRQVIQISVETSGD
ncbi:MAG TPA: molybdopterin-dependent oxidoreductase [Pirellulales bacterium]|jgi:hypothetical protein|nr:molybdopterin-dependent oxidoreductase [Pirellulales bacterium]